MFKYKNIAILGGTFDPVHYGHLLIAEQAYFIFPLEQFFFMPAGVPPHKQSRNLSSSEHRLRMLELAVRGNEHFSVSRYEIEKKGLSYTVDTLRYLSGLGLAEKIYFIIGADSLLDIFSWREPDFLLKNGHLIVARRPEFDINYIYRDEKYKPYLDNILLMYIIMVDFSSSKIRQLVKEGKSIRYQTPDAVIDYIEENQLSRG